MKFILFSFVASTVTLGAADPQLPTFSGKFGTPLELSLIERTRLGLSFPAKGALATSSLPRRQIEVTARNFQSRMPVAAPESGVDHKMSIVPVDTIKSYKLLVQRPNVER
jgi:hypothetical protein